MFYTDTHIHLQDYKHIKVEDVVNNAAKNNIFALINPSAHPSDWLQVAQLSEQYSQIIPAFGVHPWYINNVENDWLIKLENLLQKYPQAMVGECGIDRLKNVDTAAQINILRPQIALAEKYERALILHMVKAHEAAQELFDELPQRTVFHSYTGPIEWGKKIVQKGFFIGCNQSILRKKNAADIMAALPLSNLLLETDGPYQSLVPQQSSLPQNLAELSTQIAAAKKITLAELQKTLYENTQKFIGDS